MGAPTEYFVDPATGTDDLTGDRGTVIGNPWLTVTFAVNNITRNITDGDRINVKEGTDDVVSAVLPIEDGYGLPSGTAPLFIEGYATDQGDGGIGGISGGGTSGILNTISAGADAGHVRFTNMHLHNTGGTSIATLANGSFWFIGCDIENTTAALAINGNAPLCQYIGCHFHNIENVALSVDGAIVMGCLFTNDGGKTITKCIQTLGTLVGRATLVLNNIFNVSSDTIGVSYKEAIVIGNTFYGAASGSAAIGADAANVVVYTIANNYFEGFSDTGGVGVDVPADSEAIIYGYNYFYDNLATSTVAGNINNIFTGGADVDLGSSGVDSAGTGDFTPTTDLQSKGYPLTIAGPGTSQFIDVGAIQTQSAAAGTDAGANTEDALVCSTPVGTRATLVTWSAANLNASRTEWEFNLSPGTQHGAIVHPDIFRISTTKSGANSADVLIYDLDRIGIWFFPDHIFSIRARQLVNGSWTSWTATLICISRGYENSFEKGQSLSANTLTITP